MKIDTAVELVEDLIEQVQADLLIEDGEADIQTILNTQETKHEEADTAQHPTTPRCDDSISDNRQDC